MKKFICKREYDTDTSEKIREYTYSYFGDPAGFEEILYQTPDGLFFLHVRGGTESPYPCEDILRLAKTKVAEWMEKHQ